MLPDTHFCALSMQKSSAAGNTIWGGQDLLCHGRNLVTKSVQLMKMVHGMDRYIQLLLSVTQDGKKMDLLYIRWFTAPEEDWNRKRSLPIPGQCKTSCTHGC
ncbi:hypothetical protein Vafri_7440 [Volvox africanus]|uniref:Uncharacterized protein n=1 Tax=Volvox africanus TaxID=51714 RepID=A0A8J4F0J7_9CHLO|nr:hypothetical protein Vafri_7440 [Volvox africanus]